MNTDCSGLPSGIPGARVKWKAVNQSVRSEQESSVVTLQGGVCVGNTQRIQDNLSDRTALANGGTVSVGTNFYPCTSA